MINATQSFHQESLGMLWAPELDVHITSMQLCAVPCVGSEIPPVSLADNHIMPFLSHFKVMKCVSKILTCRIICAAFAMKPTNTE